MVWYVRVILYGAQGSQAIKALKEEQLYVILVNPNIATVQVRCLCVCVCVRARVQS